MASTRFFSSLLGNSRLNSSRSSNNTEPLAADASPLDELDERDVVWSTTTAISTDPATTDFITRHSNAPTAADFNPDQLKASAAAESSPPISTSAVSSVSSTASGHYFHPQTAAVSGLSAALATSNGSDDDRRSPLIQRKKTAINPRLSPAGAAAVSTVVAARPYHYSSSATALSRSAPVKVPIWRNTRGRQVPVMMGRFDEEESGDEDFDDDDDDGSEMVPPHEMVARSQRTTTFSVFEGVGRTLKGRDLTRVRNAVMQKTGFLE